MERGQGWLPILRYWRLRRHILAPLAMALTVLAGGGPAHARMAISSFPAHHVSLAREYGVTSEMLSEAVALYLSKIPHFQFTEPLAEMGVTFALYGGTSREVLMANIVGIVESGSYEAWMNKLRQTKTIRWLNWHHLKSDLDFVLIPKPGLSQEARRKAEAFINARFPSSLFYKKADIIWTDDHFKQYPIMSEHFEAVSNILISAKGFLRIPEQEGVVRGKKINFCDWGVQQFLEGIFDFMINPAIANDPQPYRDMLKGLRWLRYVAELSTMKLSRQSWNEIVRVVGDVVAAKKPDLIKLIADGAQAVEGDKGSNFDGKKLIEGLQKLQRYTRIGTATTKALLEKSGIAGIFREAEAEKYLLTPLPKRNRNTPRTGKRLGTELVLYHRTSISAAQSMSWGALWASDNNTVIEGKKTVSVLAPVALYGSTEFGQVGYGDYFVKLTLHADDIEGLDYIQDGSRYAILNEDAIKSVEPMDHAQILKYLKDQFDQMYPVVDQRIANHPLHLYQDLQNLVPVTRSLTGLLDPSFPEDIATMKDLINNLNLA